MTIRHKPVSRSRWQSSQNEMMVRWRKYGADIDREEQEQYLLPILQQHAERYPKNGSLLEIGCGPVCLSQYLPQQHKSFLDPLIEDFRNRFPGTLPEGELLSTTAERISKTADTFDLVICLNTISFTLNPELVMHEIERVLKPEGTLVINMRVYSPLEARLHYWAGQIFPSLCTKMRPYCYSLKGIKNTLRRHFEIKEESDQDGAKMQLPFKRKKMVFICSPRKASATAQG